MSAFSELQSVLAKWPRNAVPQDVYADNSLERLRAVLASMQRGENVADAGDLAGLVRHVLRRQTILHSEPAPSLRVPRHQNWPDATLWKQSHLQVDPADSNSFLLRAPRDWSAEWLPGSETTPPLRAAFAEEARRDAWPTTPQCPLDPALTEELGLNFENYSCPGQRQAIHAAFFLRPGGTLVVNLPTGSGKSLVAWAPGLMAKHGALTVVVTPTVALALDQERQLREQFPSRISSRLPEHMAWHSGLSDEVKKAIRGRLFDGSQRIILASPEAIVTSLSRPLYETAKARRLAYFVVDEAHLVAQWGTEFRPEFQSMCGLRRELLRECPTSESKFKTLLLSATLSQESVDILRELFSDEYFNSVSAVTLRSEPEYWMSYADHETRRTQRIIQLIRVAPRPFLLYVTTREQATEWTNRMRELRIRRSGCVHGATDANVRADVIDRWRSGDLESVVATSAFGLGMDKADVRAVIHACVPESVDRYYQEVGRGGRDGKACVSFLVYTEEDLEIARGLSSKKVITIEKGLIRWNSMIHHARRDHQGRCLLNLSQQPPGVSRDTEANNEWNLRTVVLLNRAKVIKIESLPPPNVERKPDETDEEYQARQEEVMAEYALTCSVRLLEDSHLSEDLWQKRVEPLRQTMLNAGRRNVDLMKDVLRGKREVAEVLTGAYSLTGDDLQVDPVPVCAGCPVCRKTEARRFIFSLPEPTFVSHVVKNVDSALAPILGTSATTVFVSCPVDDGRMFRKRLLQFVLPRFAELGIREFAAPPDIASEKLYRHLYRHVPERFAINREIHDADPLRSQIRVPRVTLFLPTDQKPMPADVINLDRSFHAIFVWDDTPDAVRPHQRMFDRTVHTQFNDLVARLGS